MSAEPASPTVDELVAARLAQHYLTDEFEEKVLRRVVTVVLEATPDEEEFEADEYYRGQSFRRKVENAIEQQLREAVTPTAIEIAEKTLRDGAVYDTNQYGERRGQPKPLMEVIAGEVRKVVEGYTTTRNHRDHQVPGVEQLIRSETTKWLREHLSGTIDSMKENIANAVTKDMQQAIADAAKKSLPAIEYSVEQVGGPVQPSKGSAAAPAPPVVDAADFGHPFEPADDPRDIPF